jgi:hypothetical protein
MNLETILSAELESGNSQVVDRIFGRDVTRGDLSVAFSRVENKENWKLPIDTRIEIQTDFDMESIRRAVVFFTASEPTFEPLGKHRYRVRAAGYYAVCGA